MPFFSVKFLSKFMYIYHMDIVLSLILIVSQMLKLPRAKVEVHFLNKFVFVINKCLAQDPFRNRKPFKIHRITRRVMCTIFLFSVYFNAILLSELYLLSRCPSPYKQSLSQFKNNLRDAFTNAEKIDVTFTNPLVNEALKFCVVR